VLDRLFRLGVWIKGIDGLLEIVGGVALALVGPQTLNHLATFLTQRELAEDPSDRVATFLRDHLQHLSGGVKLAGSLYLVSHGIAKVLLMIGLLRNVRWAYPLAEVFLMVFIAYEAYRLTIGFSLPLVIVLALDGAILVLIWREQRQRWGLSAERSMEGSGS
jgi:uncharacterized membrane protein